MKKEAINNIAKDVDLEVEIFSFHFADTSNTPEN